MKTKFVILLLAMFAFSAIVQAQQIPTIVRFSIDLPDTPITVDATERGDISATLNWHVIHTDVSGHTLLLEAYRINGWVRITNEAEDDAPWDFVGSRTLDLQHPLNFGIPTYRLTLLDNDENILEQRIITVPYDEIEDTPQIVAFDRTDNAGSNVGVVWDVINRIPTSNLTFEQVLSDGSAVSVELPRSTMWIASAGEGAVAPVEPEGEIRLRVVDVITGEVYDESSFPLSGTTVVQTGGGNTAAPSERPAVCPPSNFDVPIAGHPGDGCHVGIDDVTGERVEILYFTVDRDHVPPGESVVLSWEVRGAEMSMLHVYDRRDILNASTGTTVSPIEIIEVPHNGGANIGNVGYMVPSELEAGVRLVLWAGNWHSNGSSPSLFAFIAYRILDVTPPVQDEIAQIQTFTANLEAVAPGEAVRLTWEAEGGELAIVEMRDASQLGGRFGPPPVYRTFEVPLSGSLDVTVPETFILGATFTLSVANRHPDNLYTKLAGRSLRVGMRLPPDQNSHVINVAAAYQPFQTGFMVWMDNHLGFWVFQDSGFRYQMPEDQVAALPENPVTEEPPPGLYKPVSGFGRLWGNNEVARNALGWGTAPEQPYTTTFETFTTADGAVNYYLMLPDGRVVHLQTGNRWAYRS